MRGLYQNYASIRQRIDAAAKKAGRDPEEITLIAVSKTKPLEDIEELMASGVKDFGENKVQELAAKYDQIMEKAAGGVYGDLAGQAEVENSEAVRSQGQEVEKKEAVQSQGQEAEGKPVRFHLIGHLQRNKVKQVISRACLIHSVDSLRLAQEIEKEAEKQGLSVNVLVEVNIGAEESKSGTTPETAPELVRQIAELPHVHVKGLMCVAPIVEDPEEARPYFHRMKELAAEIDAMGLAGVSMKELSMGMTADFEVAVEEGATFVRVGTAIFGHRNYNI
ncbi:MAG: YggS family pyridoxal phosphate-dependent enzyme [Lachnospiraceae bacterium]|nr:YggS family pyridoxal phosphate-dependent enzyme [Lachnospiraceae bacterium]